MVFKPQRPHREIPVRNVQDWGSIFRIPETALHMEFSESMAMDVQPGRAA